MQQQCKNNSRNHEPPTGIFEGGLCFGKLHVTVSTLDFPSSLPSPSLAPLLISTRRSIAHLHSLAQTHIITEQPPGVATVTAVEECHALSLVPSQVLVDHSRDLYGWGGTRRGQEVGPSLSNGRVWEPWTLKKLVLKA